MAPKKEVPAAGKKPKPAPKPKSRLLFILKAQGLYGDDNSYIGAKKSSGLLNSAMFVVDMLNQNGVQAELEIATDNNDIDRMVTQHRPTHVIIEALWVVPEKFEVLQRLHPSVQWIIRCHSEIPFLSQEGIAMKWLFEYIKKTNVRLAFNSDRTTRDIRQLLRDSDRGLYSASDVEQLVMYLPNYYPLSTLPPKPFRSGKTVLHVGAFGAIRPLKNQLIQAVAAIQYAEKNGFMMSYHINANRVEQKGDSQLKNIRNLFGSVSSRFQLIEHDWLDRPEFLKLCREMDIGLQMSFTESFNIIAADLVSNGIPTVTSPEVRWMDSLFQAKPTDVSDIVAKMESAMTWKRFVGKVIDWNLRGLTAFDKTSLKTWLTIFSS